MPVGVGVRGKVVSLESLEGIIYGFTGDDGGIGRKAAAGSVLES